MNNKIENIKKLIDNFKDEKVNVEEFIKFQKDFTEKIDLDLFVNIRNILNSNPEEFAKELGTIICRGIEINSPLSSDEVITEKQNKISKTVLNVLLEIRERNLNDRQVYYILEELDAYFQTITTRIRNDIELQKRNAVAKLLGDNNGFVPLAKTFDLLNENDTKQKQENQDK